MRYSLRAWTGLAASLLSFTAFGPAHAADTTINALFMTQAAYSESDVRDMTTGFEKANPDIKVHLEFVPYEGLHDKTTLAQGSGGYDVVLFDVIWPAEYARNSVLQDVTKRITPEMKKNVIPGAWTTVTYKDKYYGLPWILDTKYLYYNKAMLKKAGISSPPETWSEVLKDARIIKDKGILEHPIAWSWAQAEAVICDYATLVDAYGGKFLTDDGKPAFQADGGLEALQYMVKSTKEGLSNPNSKEFLEEDVRRIFQNGQAAFALNWTYMYNLANDSKQSKVAGDVGIEPAPGVKGKTDVSAVNGSMGLGITSNTKNPDAAWKYVKYMTSQKVQDKYAKLSLPIWKSSYDDPAVVKGQEALISAAKQSLAKLFPRPTTPDYQELSKALQVAIQKALLDTEAPKDALQEAADNSGL